jgi:hypothetical protein
MSFLRLIGLSCSRTQEAEDEIRLTYTADWRPEIHAVATVLHPHTMDVGDSITLSYEPEFEHAALLSLWEVDRNPDDFIGSVMVTPYFEGAGETTFTIERPGMGSYDLTLEVTRDRPTAALPRLRLLSLHCGDAQEIEDEMVVHVNGREVWSGDMRTDDTVTLDLPIDFRSEALVQLWERDRRGSQAFGSLVVDLRHRGAGPQEASFSVDEGIVGDATYRLRYQVE